MPRTAQQSTSSTSAFTDNAIMTAAMTPGYVTEASKGLAVRMQFAAEQMNRRGDVSYVYISTESLTAEVPRKEAEDAMDRLAHDDRFTKVFGKPNFPTGEGSATNELDAIFHELAEELSITAESIHARSLDQRESLEDGEDYEEEFEGETYAVCKRNKLIL